MTPQLAKDLILVHRGKGMTPSEALSQFDRASFDIAMLEDFHDNGWESPLLQFASEAGREEMNERDMQKALELWCAGWKSTVPSPSAPDIMSLYWRRPPRRPASLGMLFRSTDQAYNHLLKNKSTTL